MTSTNTTSQELYTENLHTPANNRTFICFGSPRCGTSMIAGALHSIGIRMGTDLPVNIEDPAFNIDGKRQQRARFLAQARAEIDQNNKAMKKWGWKYPQAVEYLDELKPSLRNPSLIIVYRDPVPAGIRASRSANNDNKSAKVAFEVNKCLELYSRNLDLCQRWSVPTLLVSYEKASLHPQAFLEELALFSGVTLPDDLSPILEFMKPGSYKSAPEPS